MTSATELIYSSRQKITGTLFALVAAIGFSAKAILVNSLYRTGGCDQRCWHCAWAFSLPFFLNTVCANSNRNKRNRRLTGKDMLAVVGVRSSVTTLPAISIFLGLAIYQCGAHTVLYPTMVVRALVFKHKIGRTALFALVISYAGITLSVHDMDVLQHDALSGAILVFASALAYAVYLVGAGHTIARIGATRFTAYVMTVACAACMVRFAVGAVGVPQALDTFVQGL